MLEVIKTVTPSPEQWEIVIEGMRNPMNSWANMDSVVDGGTIDIGQADNERMLNLAKGGPVHAKYRRMLPVIFTLNAPLYWWKEMETYRTGIAPNPTDIDFNACSTMHRITEKHFEMDDFSTECLLPEAQRDMQNHIDELNYYRSCYLDWKAKKRDDLARDYWYTLIQRLPTNYNQKRTIGTNYEALSAMYHWRHEHKLSEWRTLCEWMKTLPHCEIITLEETDNG